MSLQSSLDKYSRIASIQAVLDLQYHKPDYSTSAVASLQLSKDTLELRLYRTGFLVGELRQKDGILFSKPQLDKAKKTLLVDAIKQSFFWWANICSHIIPDNDTYFAPCDDKTLVIDKQTHLPLRQSIELPSGQVLQIDYFDPAYTTFDNSTMWYPSRLHIQYGNHTLQIEVTDYEVAFSHNAQ